VSWRAGEKFWKKNREKIRNYSIFMAWEPGNLKTDTNTYYNITLFLSVNIGRNYWF
jgi:hypothetical protein